MPNLSRRIGTLGLATAIVTGCAERSPITLAQISEPLKFLVEEEPVRDGSTSEYSFTTTVVHENKEDWINRPDVEHGHTYGETHVWSSADDFWDVTYDISSTASPLGP
jgi:hypothetical protein